MMKKPIYVIGLEYYFPQLKEHGGYIYDSYFTDKGEADKECEIARKKIQAWETKRGKQLPTFIPVEAILTKIYVKELKLKEDK
jgi:hypothetical protein